MCITPVHIRLVFMRQINKKGLKLAVYLFYFSHPSIDFPLLCNLWIRSLLLQTCSDLTNRNASEVLYPHPVFSKSLRAMLIHFCIRWCLTLHNFLSTLLSIYSNDSIILMVLATARNMSNMLIHYIRSLFPVSKSIVSISILQAVNNVYNRVKMKIEWRHESERVKNTFRLLNVLFVAS